MQHNEAPRTVMPERHGMALCRVPASVMESDQIVPVVLEFVQPPVAVYMRQNPKLSASEYQEKLEASHWEFLSKMSSLGLDVQLGRSSAILAGPEGQETVVNLPHDFTHVFNGIGLLMPGRAVQTISVLSGLRAITLNQERVYLSLAESVPFIGAPKIWEQVDKAGVPIKGDGIVVAVIDTGVDWTHPMLGGFSEVPNEKVIHAVSLTSEGPQDSFGHGTHVAGTIAGNKEYKGTPRGDALLNGVAPKAKILGYKVLTASGTGSATNIILAMEDAVKRGAHVMNLSLGSAYGDPVSPESSAANNAMLAGVIVCLAAGNAGPESYTIGAPGAAHHVITVGASTDDGVTALVAQLIEENGDISSVDMRLMEGSQALATPAVELNYVNCGQALQASDFPSQVKDRVALVGRGENTFYEKAMAAQQAGALACVVYNNREGNYYGSLGEEQPMPTIPTVSISMQDGQRMLTGIDQETKISRAKLRLNPVAVPQPNRLAEFSSRGPNRDRWIKPELCAPGVNITSGTVLEAGIPGGGMPDPSGYISASGTSMATPHVAGVAALMRQAHPEWTSMQIKAALVNTCDFMPGEGDVMAQGNGVINLKRAMDCRGVLVTATDSISPTLSFGAVVNGGKEVKVTQDLTILPLTNPPDPGTYNLSVAIVGQPEGLKAELNAVSNGAAPDGNATFSLTLTADGTVLADNAYHGWVIAQAEWGTLRLPFYYEAAREASAIPPIPSGPKDPQVELPIRKRWGVAARK